MTNSHSGRAAAANGPAIDMLPVTPDDTLDLPHMAAALYAEVGGDVTIVTRTGAQRTVAVADMAILPVQVTRVLASGTTATGLHALITAS